ncbi:protein MAIN-LIKE 1-like [Lotus japonicus]|uniref:protein MAIN-LIKE 1-like n=1 Tax=Lotus japonicus TaxID=34305 RepID=UPI0025876C6C|nr:protein MAIN-LIKE 1-like [Lotus japonicus]
MDFLQSGPVDTSLLCHQEEHISNEIWKHDDYVRMLRARHRWHVVTLDLLDHRVKDEIVKAGFGPIISINDVTIDQQLVNALVERWRRETHTFHFPYGEATITLQDVLLQLGLPIDGDAVTGSSSNEWGPTCLRLLGDSPPFNQLKGSMVKLTWLETLIQKLPSTNYVPQSVIEQHARAHIMLLMGNILFVESSGQSIHLMYLLLLDNLPAAKNYSWGAAVLACLYSALDRATNPNQRNIGGCMLLLQSWAYSRLQCIAPTINSIFVNRVEQGVGFPLAQRWSCPKKSTTIPIHSATNVIRKKFDGLGIDDFKWTPYPYEELNIRGLIDHVDILPNVIYAMVPLICFSTVQWHPLDRVKRQFG